MPGFGCLPVSSGLPYLSGDPGKVGDSLRGLALGFLSNQHKLPITIRLLDRHDMLTGGVRWQSPTGKRNGATRHTAS